MAAAEVTKGALYHHYSGKQALFEAVFEATEDVAVQHITHEIGKVKDPWERANVGVRAFMEVCQQPRFRRIVMQEGPVALGLRPLPGGRRAQHLRTGPRHRRTGAQVLRRPRGIVDTFTRVFYGAMTSAGMSVASAEDPEAAGREVETVIGIVLAGLRQLAESGVDLLDPSPTPPVRSETPA